MIEFEAGSDGSGGGLVEEDVLPGAGAKGEGVAGAKLVVARGGDLGIVDIRAIAGFEVDEEWTAKDGRNANVS